MAKSKNYGGLVVLLVVIAATAGGGWYYFKGRGDRQPEFNTVKITRGDITQTVTATGDLQPVITVDVGAQVSGQIKEVLVDFNSRVKAGDILALIDESTPTQRLRQAEADLESAKANNRLIQLNVQRTLELFEKNLVSQQELDNVQAQLAQSNSTLLTREAAVANATLDLERCTIRAPIDGIVLNRNTDKGRTVNASMNAPILFTLVNDLEKMQINAAVAEADIGMIQEGQPVRFTVDAFPNRVFTGGVRQVRNAASTNQNVVSYATIIDVSNDDLRLKPGMTANVSIVVSDRPGVLRVPNQALRVRIPQEVQALVSTPEIAGASAGPGGEGTAKLTDDERRQAMFAIMREVGFQPGSPATPEMIEQARTLAKDKGLDPEVVSARFTTPGARGGRTGGGSGGRSMRGGDASSGERGLSSTVVSRPVYRLMDPNSPVKRMEQVTARLGVSDGIHTEIIAGLSEGDTLVTAITLPGASPSQPGGMQNPFQTSSRGSSHGYRSR
jgi:HlyD family secretion protein